MSVPEETPINFPDRQLQRKFKHAEDFGVEGGYSLARADAFRKSMQAHLDDAGTVEVQGTLRGALIIHHVNPQTGLDVMENPVTREFVSGWKLNIDQLRHVLITGKLGGG